MMDNNKPSFVNRTEMIADKDYVLWLDDVKRRYKESQLKASVKVNSELLSFYWSLGHDIVTMNIENVYGKNIMTNLSMDLQKTFPGQKGFSTVNLYFMKRWYLFYTQADGIFYQAGKKSDMPEKFALIPWRHHTDIISNCQTIKEALFYIDKTIEGNWSRKVLEAKLKANLYTAQGAATTNFSDKLPALQGKLAQNVLKDPYHFEFLTMKADYDEKDLEDALVSNITHFLLELGKGFAFVGRQMELRMPNGESYYPDLIFYHIPLKCYVVIDLKAVQFMPEFVGKMNFYVTAADKLLRGEGDNPSIGLIICKSTDKTVVEWSLQDINKPLGVAAYQLQEVVERTVIELELRNKNEKKESEE